MIQVLKAEFKNGQPYIYAPKRFTTYQGAFEFVKEEALLCLLHANGNGFSNEEDLTWDVIGGKKVGTEVWDDTDWTAWRITEN